ncbi:MULTISPECIES: hemerythrin domain-containing protein [Shewanella]|uniref:hemerythrin domain-containing protein n=1 Tax=Shewanella TaxID=22 RepID=UPI00048F0D9E|nr:MULTISPECIES: hemerythrin domain-containing protein [Shewanella]
MLTRLKKDHQHIAILLQILADKHQRLLAGEMVNYNLIRDIVEYMQSYAEHSHHPLEDVIYKYHAQAFPDDTQTEELLAEHDKLNESSCTIMSTLNLILADVPVQKEQLCDDLAAYFTLQGAHLRFEEKHVFPVWKRNMRQDDWDNIEAQCAEKLMVDPLFSDDDNQVFEELREYIAKASD